MRPSNETTIFLSFFFPSLLVGVTDLSLGFGVTEVSQSIMIGISLLQEGPAPPSESSELEGRAALKGMTRMNIIHTCVHASCLPDISIFFICLDYRVGVSSSHWTCVIKR